MAKKKAEEQLGQSRARRVPIEELDKQIEAAEDELREIVQLKCDIRMPESLPNDPSYTLFFPCGKKGEQMSLLLRQGSGTWLLAEAPRYLKEGAVRQLGQMIEYAKQAVENESPQDVEVEPYTGNDPEEFAAAMGFTDDLVKTQELAKECFEGLEKVTLVVEGDPESTERWVAVRVDVVGSVGDVVTQNHAFHVRFACTISSNGQDHLRLQYNIL
jgi:hypothetical protein